LQETQSCQSSSQHTTDNVLDVTDWIIWFLDVLSEAIQHGIQRIERVLIKSQFWQKHSQTILTVRQVKILNRLLDFSGEEFTLGINASKYQRLAKVSKATATRDLIDLVDKNCFEKLPASGRSTRYVIKLDTQV